MQAVRNRIAGDLHDEIGSTLSSISIYSKVVQNRTKEKVPEAEPYLQKINSDIGAMMEAMSDIVWTINSSNDRFENIFSRMRSSAGELLEAKNYTLHFEFDEAMNGLKLDMEQRKDFYLIFKEALNNIAKYAEGKNVWIKLSKANSKIEMQIRDDGKGFTLPFGEGKSGAHGNGMNTMKARAEKLRGELKVESVEREGTVVALVIPIS
jgi:signal transduction histidine kinase